MKTQTIDPIGRTLKLLAKCSEVHAFEYGGIKYLGYHVDAIKDFVKNNPELSDFHVWLQQNRTVIK